MAQNTNIKIPADTWTLLTSADIANVTFQVVSENYVYIKAAVGAVAPTSKDGAIVYGWTQGEANTPLSDLFPGVTGANRIYALAGDKAGKTAEVMVSHV